MTRSVALLLRASYPKLWLYTGFLFIFGALVAYKHGAPPNGGAFAAYLLWFTVFCNIVGMLLNDHFDRALDAHNPRKAGIPRLTPWQTAIGIGISLAAFGVVYAAYPSPIVGLLTLGALLANLIYSAPPLRLKELPPFDVLIGPGSYLPVVLAGYALGTGALPGAGVVAAGILFFAGADLAFKTLDIEADARGGARTSAVILGASLSLGLAAALEALGPALLWRMDFRYALASLPYLGVIAFIYHYRRSAALDALLPAAYAAAGFVVTLAFVLL